MKRKLAGVMLCVLLFLCLSSSVRASLVNQFHGGGQGVYDAFNDAHRFPHFSNRTNWILAADEQISDMPWGFGTSLKPQYANRTISSPYLSAKAYSGKFFASTGQANFSPLFGTNEFWTDVYNGCTTDEIWDWHRNYSGTAKWGWEGANAHWMAVDLLNPGKNATMMFSYKQHYLPFNFTKMTFDGIGAWIVPTAQPFPVPGAFILASLGTGVVGWLRRRRTL